MDDRSVRWSPYVAKYFIVPIKNTDLKKYWSTYLKEIRRLRADSNTKELVIKHDFAAPKKFGNQFEVASLTAASVVYGTASGEKRKMPSGANWNKGIVAMIDGTKAIKDLSYLPVNEWNKLKEVTEKLRDL